MMAHISVTLSHDSSLQELKKTKCIVKFSALLSDSTISQLSLPFSSCAKFYAGPKVHKLGIPFCPTVSNIGIASYHLAKFLTIIISPLLSANIHTVKNSINFTKIIQNFPSSNLTMVSFNVKSFFTNVLINGALFYLEKRLKEFHYTALKIEELIILICTCLSQTIFSFQGHFYKQSEGLAMGTPLSAILGDIYMHYFENTFFEKISQS